MAMADPQEDELDTGKVDQCLRTVIPLPVLRMKVHEVDHWSIGFP